MSDPSDLYASLPVFTGFASLMDPALYQALPGDWLVGLADVVDSTRAIAEGRYKVVNMAGAAVVAAMKNALQLREFPFVFAGDGASFAVGPADGDLARNALAVTAAWVRDELGLELRVALVSVAAIRERDFDVRVARFAPSPHVAYAMFSGGGLAWAEAAMKRGCFAVQAAPPGSRPDLAGLSCRWQEIRATRGVILSLLVVPVRGGDDPKFRTLVEEFLAALEDSPEVAHPLRDGGLALRWPSGGLDLEARTSRKPGQSLAARRASLLLRTLLSFFVFRLGIRVGRFDPNIYLRELVENSDFRKYDDGLRMTLDCTPVIADRIEARLERAEAEGTIRLGLHRQPAAIVTCITPSVYDSGHVHFVDGSAGGYASAALKLKARAVPASPSHVPASSVPNSEPR
jgi:hypothetical protein